MKSRGLLSKIYNMNIKHNYLLTSFNRTFLRQFFKSNNINKTYSISQIVIVLYKMNT